MINPVPPHIDTHADTWKFSQIHGNFFKLNDIGNFP